MANLGFKSLNNKDKISWKQGFSAIRYLPRFFKEIRKESGSLFWLNIFFRLVSSFTPILILWVGKMIIDEVIKLSTIKNNDWDLYDLYFYIAIEFGLVIISDLFNRGTNLTDGFMGDKYSNASSVTLIKKTQEVNLSDLEDPSFYDKLNMARTQTAGRVNLMSNVLSQFQDIITIGSLIIGLVVYEPWLILLLVASVIPAFINELKFTSSSYSLARSWTSERRELDYLRFIGANDKTAKELKLFGLANFIATRFETLSLNYYNANKNLTITRTIWASAFNVLGTICYYGAYLIIVIKTVKGALTIGILTFLASSFNRLRGNLSNVFGRFSRIAESALYLQDYFEFIDMETEEATSFKRLPMPSTVVKGFEFRNVHFEYPNANKKVLSGINLFIKAGEKMAFVGENGSGKTTLIKLLLRFYDPTEGAIYLDDVDIRHYDRHEYQQLFGVIFQDFVQYEFTVGENIAVGKIEFIDHEEKIQQAAEKSLADDVVNQFSNKYNQLLGKRFKSGKELSGGQWQKIALARAYMKDAQVMVLDEPTSALDARAEYEAFQRFIALTKERTSVIISHRFSTVRMADNIMVLIDGKIKEIGTHQQLMEINGLYAELFQLQAAGYN
jgi:ATP-binding cassette, subfamily B, bacterial